MSKQFITNIVQVEGYQTFITVLDKDIVLDELIEVMFELLEVENESILIDAAIIHGINNYRFVSAHPQGNFYVFPTEQEVERANDILRSYPENIKNTYYKYYLTSKLFDSSIESEVENEPVKLYSMSYR